MACEKCGVQHDGSYASGRFCSSRCSRSFSTTAKRQEINKKVSLKLRKKEVVCLACGWIFEGTRAGQQLAGHRQFHKRKFEDLKGDGTRKRWLIRERGRRCEICGITEWMGKETPIELDHVDGHPGHNQKENLRLICPNCHAQTEHYRGRNANHHKDTVRQNTMKKYPNYRMLKISGFQALTVKQPAFNR
jgi:hypothetical protein